MRKLTALFAILLTLGMAQTVWAFNCPGVSSTTTPLSCTLSLFNDSGSALTSGAVVVWDNDDTEFDRTGYPYITTTTTADLDWPAGVVADGSCADQSFCNVIVYGWARTNMAQTTDRGIEDQPVATTTVAGQAGDWAGTTLTCYLGLLLEDRSLDTGSSTLGDLVPMAVWVDPGCEE